MAKREADAKAEAAPEATAAAEAKAASEAMAAPEPNIASECSRPKADRSTQSGQVSNTLPLFPTREYLNCGIPTKFFLNVKTRAMLHPYDSPTRKWNGNPKGAKNGSDGTPDMRSPANYTVVADPSVKLEKASESSSVAVADSGTRTSGAVIDCHKYHLKFRVPPGHSSIQEFVNLKEQPVKATNACLWDALHEAMIDAGIFKEEDEPKIKDNCLAYMKAKEIEKETNKESKGEKRLKKGEISGGDHPPPPASSAIGGGAFGSEALSSVHSLDAKVPAPMPATAPAPVAAATEKKFKVEFQNMEFCGDSRAGKPIAIADFYRVFLL